jgi:CheY-like chemotaxis protein
MSEGNGEHDGTASGRGADQGGAKLRAAMREADRRGAAAPAMASAAREMASLPGRPSVAPTIAAILVVETDPDLQWRLARQLTVRGHRVVGTGSPEGALALLEAWPVDLVLIDADLRSDTGVTAVDLARDIRERHPDIRVALMTGEPPREEQRLAARLAGAMACLVKPFRAEAIAEVLALLKLPTPALQLQLVPVG